MCVRCRALGKPAAATPAPHSSEKERAEPKERTRRTKLAEVQMGREEKIELDRMA